jgi:hypothetical protein
MNFRFSPIFLIPVGISLLASCYPIPDGPQGNRQGTQQAEQTISSEEQQKIQEQRDRMREEAERREQQQQAEQRNDRPTSPPPPPEPRPRSDYPFATPVPGKEGFVFSPYNNKVVDVRDIPSGTLVQDPTYPPADKKYFRVP